MSPHCGGSPEEDDEAYLKCIGNEQHRKAPVVLRGACPEARFAIGQHGIGDQIPPGDLPAADQQPIHLAQHWHLHPSIEWASDC